MGNKQKLRGTLCFTHVLIPEPWKSGDSRKMWLKTFTLIALTLKKESLMVMMMKEEEKEKEEEKKKNI